MKGDLLCLLPINFPVNTSLSPVFCSRLFSEHCRTFLDGPAFNFYRSCLPNQRICMGTYETFVLSGSALLLSFQTNI